MKEGSDWQDVHSRKYLPGLDMGMQKDLTPPVEMDERLRRLCWATGGLSRQGCTRDDGHVGEWKRGMRDMKEKEKEEGEREGEGELKATRGEEMSRWKGSRYKGVHGV